MLNWGRFKPIPPTEQQIKEKETTIKNNFHAMEKYAKNNNYRKLKSDYLGIGIYYYCDKTKILYKVSNWRDSPLNFEFCNDRHILELNGIKENFKSSFPSNSFFS